MNFSNKEKFSIFFIIALIIFSFGLRIFRFFKNPTEEINRVAITKQAVAPIVQDNIPSTSSQEIIIDQPLQNESLASPYAITGKARGSWFFEASFPLKIVDEQAKVLGSGLANAQTDWMTSNFVPFIGYIKFLPGEMPASGTKVFLVLSKDNPSGLPEHDASTSVPIIIN
ncbi:MAG: Gmad2 immunoglobulin-like domain-containing protein [Patescibacteria group bacterium]